MRYTTETIEEPTSEPATVAQLVAHLHTWADAGEDDELSRALTTAREQFESDTDWRIVMPTGFRQAQGCWPSCGQPIELQRAKVISVERVYYYDSTGTATDLADWQSDLSGIPALVYLPHQSYPALDPHRPRPVVIEYTAGFSDYEPIPASIITAILEMAAFHYRVREAGHETNFKPVRLGWERIIDQWRTGLNTI